MLVAVVALMTMLPVAAQYRGHHRPYYQPARTTYRHHVTDVYYGLRLGVDVATVNSDDQYLDGGSAKTGLNVGMVIGFQIAPTSPVYLETGLSYMEKGGKGMCNGSKFTYSLDYLEMPFVLKYVYNFDRYASVQPFLGGYLGIGIAGKIKDFGERRAYSSYDNEGFKRVDAGIRVGCGLQYDFLYAELGYDFGLANVSHDYFDSAHTGCFFATIGVNF